MDRLLSTKQVADRLGVDTKTVLRYLRQGKLKGARIGRDYRIAEGAVTTLLSTAAPTAVPATATAAAASTANGRLDDPGRGRPATAPRYRVAGARPP